MSAEELNRDFLAWMQEEWQGGACSLDWSDGVRDYMKQRAALSNVGTNPSVSDVAKPATPCFAAPLTAQAAGGIFGASAPPASVPLPVATPSMAPILDGADASKVQSDAPIEVWKQDLKLQVFRCEKRNEDGEVIPAGWKPIGKGQMRLLCVEGTHFVEFRPLLSEGGGASNEAEDEVANTRSRYGRPVLSATLRADTDFTVKGKAVTAKLFAVSASGAQEYAMYYMPMGSADVAKQFADVAKSSRPSA